MNYCCINRSDDKYLLQKFPRPKKDLVLQEVDSTHLPLLVQSLH